MNYLRAQTLQQALTALAERPRRVICGGTDAYADRPAGQPAIDWLDISQVASLRGVALHATEIRIGAATRWQELAESAQLPAALREAATQVGSRQIRVQGTLGGNLCHAASAADGIPPLLALDARVELAGLDGVRCLPLAAFLLGRRRTALQPQELLTAVLLSTAPADETSAFEKLANRDGSALAVVSAAVRLRWRDDGAVASAAVAVGCASEMPVRLRELEARLEGAHREDLPQVIQAAPLPELAPLDDCRGSADLRRHLARVAIQRATARSGVEVGDGVSG